MTGSFIKSVNMLIIAYERYVPPSQCILAVLLKGYILIIVIVTSIRV